jgi:hypothetical protein
MAHNDGGKGGRRRGKPSRQLKKANLYTIYTGFPGMNLPAPRRGRAGGHRDQRERREKKISFSLGVLCG